MEGANYDNFVTYGIGKLRKLWKKLRIGVSGGSDISVQCGDGTRLDGILSTRRYEGESIAFLSLSWVAYR